MKNVLRNICLFIITAGMLSSCSSTSNLTSCPSFDSKSKTPRTLVFKKKAKKKVKKDVRVAKTELKRVVQPSVAELPMIQSAVAVTGKAQTLPSLNMSVEPSFAALNKDLPVAPVKTLTAPQIEEIITASNTPLLTSVEAETNDDLGLVKANVNMVEAPMTKKERKAVMKEAKKEVKALMAADDVSDGKTAAIVSYLWLLGLLIAWLALHQEGNSFSAFHIRQALGIAIAGIALGIIAIIPIVGWIAAAVGGILLFIDWIIGFIGALSGTAKPVFFLGKQFQKWFSGIN